LETDVQPGLNVGMDAALTLTGATNRTETEASSIKPTYIIRDLGDLLPFGDQSARIQVPDP
jgi:ribonucleotide monophosphatase NagD (HAD superfamily)